ncbi:hypothetical protein SAMN04487996_102283 [Dyadobacter soli]|uniref:Uncharacterized protein n=1 Tax=Dyadobacter soli TaxID=659014 RepID=A0A1G6XX89_9BACT|nr:hypothetical protein [Dyadobacter soli]SDD82601.1 hypothetical protein SAMN04487996_102283 [Dyadobacter soli]
MLERISNEYKALIGQKGRPAGMDVQAAEINEYVVSTTNIINP